MIIKRISVILSTLIVVSLLTLLLANKWLSLVVPWYINMFVDDITVSSLEVTKVNHQEFVVSNVRLTYESHLLATDMIIEDLTINYDIGSLITLQRFNQIRIGATQIDIIPNSINHNNSINIKPPSDNEINLISILSAMINLDDYALPFNDLSVDKIDVNYHSLIKQVPLSFHGNAQVKSHSHNHSFAQLRIIMAATHNDNKVEINITNNINYLNILLDANNKNEIRIVYDKSNIDNNEIKINNYINLNDLFNVNNQEFYQSILSYLDESHPMIMLLDEHTLSGQIEQEIIIKKEDGSNNLITKIQTLTHNFFYQNSNMISKDNAKKLSQPLSFSLGKLTFSSTIETEIDALKKSIKSNKFNNIKINANNIYVNKNQQTESHFEQLNIQAKAVFRPDVNSSSRWQINMLDFQILNLLHNASNATISALKTTINEFVFAIDSPYFNFNKIQLSADNLSINNTKVNQAAMSLNQLNYGPFTTDNVLTLKPKQLVIDDINLYIGELDHDSIQVSPFRISTQSTIKLNHCMSNNHSYWQLIDNEWFVSELLMSQKQALNLHKIIVSPIVINIADQTQNNDYQCNSNITKPLQIKANTNEIKLTQSTLGKTSDSYDDLNIHFVDNRLKASLSLLEHIVIDGDISSMIAELNAPVEAHFKHKKDNKNLSSLYIKSQINQTIEDEKSLFQKLNINSNPLVKHSHITEGNINVGMKLLWQKQSNPPSKISALLDYQLNNVSAYIDDIALENINSQGTIEWLPTIRTRKNLALSIGKIQPGISLSNFKTEIDLTPTSNNLLPTLTLKYPSFSVFNGTVSSNNISTDLNDLSTTFMVNLQSLDLNTLVQQNNIPNISVSGKIEGVLPVSINKSNVSINRGHVSTIGKGQLSYQPDNEENIKDSIIGIDSVLLALKEFNYSSLRSDVNYQPDGQLELALEAKGVSPLLDTNRPVELNINIIQNIKKLLQSLRLVNNVNNPFSDTVEQYYQRPLHP